LDTPSYIAVISNMCSAVPHVARRISKFDPLAHFEKEKLHPHLNLYFLSASSSSERIEYFEAHFDSQNLNWDFQLVSSLSQFFVSFSFCVAIL